jgi:hypothetical protein
MKKKERQDRRVEKGKPGKGKKARKRMQGRAGE